MTKRDESFFKCFHYTGNVKQQVLFTLYVDCKVKYQSEIMFLAVLAYEITIFSETLVGHIHVLNKRRQISCKEPWYILLMIYKSTSTKN